MIDVKQAARIAKEYMAEMFPPQEIGNLMLEEAELSDDGSSWRVTVSFSEHKGKSAIEAMTGIESKRSYKDLKIRAEDGTVLAMKIRQV